MPNQIHTTPRTRNHHHIADTSLRFPPERRGISYKE
jgi:hypothetical protein